MTRMAPPRTLEALDALTKGLLKQRLREWKAEGLSLIARHDRLRDEFGLDVSTSTIARWSDALERETAA